jgi:type IV pilus assembly protein PilW
MIPPSPANTAMSKGLPGAEGGFSLVEVMVALVAGLALAAGIGQVFLSSKQTYQVQDQLSRLQENGRFAIDLLAHAVRMAGSLGCGSRVMTLSNTLNGSDTLYFNFAVPVAGFEAANTAPGATYAIKATYPAPSASAAKWSPNLPAVSPALIGDVIEGTDVLVVRGRRDQGANLASLNLPGAPGQLTVQTSAFDAGGCTGGKNRINGICVGDYAMVADCRMARIFQVTAADPAGAIEHAAGQGDGTNACGNWNEPPGSKPPNSLCLRYQFPSVAAPMGGIPAEVSGVATTVFFISRRDPDAANGDPNPGPSLYRRVSTGAMYKEEVVEGVESMQILYGVDSGNGNVEFVTADAIANRTVLSLRIGLLLRTVDEATTTSDTAVYDANGTSIDPVDDRRLRRVVTTTIEVRNESR